MASSSDSTAQPDFAIVSNRSRNISGDMYIEPFHKCSSSVETPWYARIKSRWRRQRLFCTSVDTPVVLRDLRVASLKFFSISIRIQLSDNWRAFSLDQQ